VTGTETAPRSTRVYSTYLAAQAVLGIVLWVALASSSTVRSWIELVPERREVTDAFGFADIGLIVTGSALGSWAVHGNKSWAVPVVAFTAGAVVYPTVYLLAWVNYTNGVGVIGLGLMVVVSTLTCWTAYQVWKISRPG
jgi:hypothetical protein